MLNFKEYCCNSFKISDAKYFRDCALGSAKDEQSFGANTENATAKSLAEIGPNLVIPLTFLSDKPWRIESTKTTKPSKRMNHKSLFPLYPFWLVSG